MKSNFKDVINLMASIVLILGILGTIVIAIKFGVDVVVSPYSYNTYTDRNVGLTILYLVAGGFVTSVEYVIMRGLGECLEFQEKLYEKMDAMNSLLTKEADKN